jgi:uncharacterized protein (DUF2252 family)
VGRLLKKGKAPDLDIREGVQSGCPAVDALIEQEVAAKRQAFIARLTELVQGKRRLLRSTHYYNLSEPERQQALRLLRDYAGRAPEPPTKDFFEAEDVCGRVSGIGSMGRFRYAVLVHGKGSAEARNVLLEFKESRPSAYDLYRQRETHPEALVVRAEHVIAMQRQSQAASGTWLGFAVDGDMSFQVRELGPHDARLDAKTARALRYTEVAQVQAAILARTHARAVMRAVGLPRLLAQLGETDAFCQRVLSFALAYADLVQRDWTRFVGQRADLEKCEQWAAG